MPVFRGTRVPVQRATRQSGRRRDLRPVPAIRSSPSVSKQQAVDCARSGSGDSRFGKSSAFCLTRNLDTCPRRRIGAPPRGQHRAGRRLVGDDERGVASACPREFRCPVEYGSRSSAPAESECPSTAHRGHSSAVEPHGSSEAACGQHSEHSGIVAAWTVARGRRRLTRRHPYSRNLGYRPRPSSNTSGAQARLRRDRFGVHGVRSGLLLSFGVSRTLGVAEGDPGGGDVPDAVELR